MPSVRNRDSRSIRAALRRRSGLGSRSSFRRGSGLRRCFRCSLGLSLGSGRRLSLRCPRSCFRSRSRLGGRRRLGSRCRSRLRRGGGCRSRLRSSRRRRRRCRCRLRARNVLDRLLADVFHRAGRGEIAEPDDQRRDVHPEHRAIPAEQDAADQKRGDGDNKQTNMGLGHERPPSVSSHAAQHALASSRTRRIYPWRSVTDMTPRASSRLKTCEAFMHWS